MGETKKRFLEIIALVLLIALGVLIWNSRKSRQEQEKRLEEIAEQSEEYEEEITTLRAEIRELRQEEEREREKKEEEQEENEPSLAVQIEKGYVMPAFGIETEWELNHVADREGILVVGAIQNNGMVRSLKDSGKEIVLYVSPFDEKTLADMKDRLGASTVLLSAEDNTPENRAVIEKMGFSVCICEGEQAVDAVSGDMVVLSAALYDDAQADITETLTRIENERNVMLVVLRGNALSATTIEENMNRIAAAEEKGLLVSGSLAETVRQIKESTVEVTAQDESEEKIASIQEEISRKEAKIGELEAKLNVLYDSLNKEE